MVTRFYRREKNEHKRHISSWNFLIESVNDNRNLHLLCFYITTLCDWFKKLALLSQPMRSKTKPSRDLRASVMPFTSTGISSSDWFIALFVFDAIGQWLL